MFDTYPFYQKVEEYDPKEGYWMVRYEDGDKEEYTTEELNEIIVPLMD